MRRSALVAVLGLTPQRHHFGLNCLNLDTVIGIRPENFSPRRSCPKCGQATCIPAFVFRPKASPRILSALFFIPLRATAGILQAQKEKRHD